MHMSSSKQHASIEIGKRSTVMVKVVRVLLLVTLVLSAAVVPTDAIQRRKEIDFDALEKAWAADDAEPELRSAADDHYDQLSSVSATDAKSLGPQMVFVTLDTNEQVTELAGRWKEMLWNGGLEVNIYEIEPRKVLIGMQKGMFMPELRSFLREQHEVVEYEWNSQRFTPDDDVGDTKGKRKGGATKKASKKRKGKGTKQRGANDADKLMQDEL